MYKYSDEEIVEGIEMYLSEFPPYLVGDVSELNAIILHVKALVDRRNEVNL